LRHHLTHRFASHTIFSPPHLQRRATIIHRTMHHLLRERVRHFTRASPSPPQQHRAASVFSAPSSLATTNLSRIQQTPFPPPSAAAANTSTLETKRNLCSIVLASITAAAPQPPRTRTPPRAHSSHRSAPPAITVRAPATTAPTGAAAITVNRAAKGGRRKGQKP